MSDVIYRMLSHHRATYPRIPTSCQTFVTFPSPSHHPAGTTSQVFTPRTFSAAHWSVVVKPTNRKPAGGGIFSPTWKFAQISKTWSEPGRCRKLSVFAAAATERGCQERPGFEGNEPTATSRWWAFCLQIHCLRLLGNSHKLNEQNLHKTQSLCPIISYIIYSEHEELSPKIMTASTPRYVSTG